MRLFVFNVVKSALELFLHAYFPWLDPLRYLDVSRSVLLARDGYLTIKRRAGPLPLPIVWHSGVHTSPLSLFALCLSVSVFFLNQGAFEVYTRDVTTRARVFTCHANAKKGRRGLLNSRAGVTHLFRTDTCHGGVGQVAPRWADAKLEDNRIVYGEKTYRCRDPVNPDILKHVGYCYNGNYTGDPCTGNEVAGKPCDASLDREITLSGIEKTTPAVLCTHLLGPNDRLFWVRNRTQGVKISGLTTFAPTTLEILRRALAPSSAFLRSQISRALDAEATVRDRPYCNWGVPGRVRNGVTYSWIRINPKWWIANAVLALAWAFLRRAGRVMVDFSNTAVCDRLRAEALGDDSLRPRKRDFLFGVARGASGGLHLGPLAGGVESVVRPEVWAEYNVRPRRKGRRRARSFTARYGRYFKGRGGFGAGDDGEVEDFE